MGAAIMRCGFAACLLGQAATAAIAGDTLAENRSAVPSALAVTVYRAPERESGTVDLDALQGFALITETRTVHLTAGLSRLRFEGVADGIEPTSAIVTGLPEGVIEKNRDARLLSPSALMAAAVGKPVMLLRTDKKTGKLRRLAGTVLSDAEGGVVFQTAEGIEALRCSGLAETFSFTGTTDGGAGLAATPTLSVQVQSAAPVTRTVTLSYLARGFDWAANYVATLSDDGKTLDLGAWVTLANGNGVGFPDAHTQVVAGRVNRESGEVEPIDMGGPILAQCWPRGSTSDQPPLMYLSAMRGMPTDRMYKLALADAAPSAEIAVTAGRRVEQEQLGDLKLYRVPERTTVAGRQSKQVRLLDRPGVPVSFVYGADIAAADSTGPLPATLLLRTKNDAANHLGLPLPSGRVAVFARRQGAELLQHESDVRDLAVDEEVEINMGESSDVRVAARAEKTGVDFKTRVDSSTRVDVSNARSAAVQFELRLRLAEGSRVVRADRTMGRKNGRPIFRFGVPANGSVTLRFQTQHMAYN
jgi:hypothetical protein